jgi:DnaJ-class molecular chaperone
MQDPYRVLNVPRNADPGAIKAAYRKLAKSLHPDRNPGDAKAEQRFKDLTRAYQLLSDPHKRARFDRGEIGADGRPRHPFGFGGGGFGNQSRDGGSGGFESIFERAFGGGFSGFRRGAGGPRAEPSVEELLRRNRAAGAGAKARQVRGADVRHRVELDFLTAARGGRQRVRLDDGRMLEIEVPPGTTDGQTLRLKGQGHPGFLGGPPGDALVEVAVAAHPHFVRKGADIHLELPVSLPEAVLGAAIEVPTIDGPVRLTVPAGANSGHTFRLRGRGVAGPAGGRGDQYVRLLVMLPERSDPELGAFLRRWAQKQGYGVRGRFERA